MPTRAASTALRAVMSLLNDTSSRVTVAAGPTNRPAPQPGATTTAPGATPAPGNGVFDRNAEKVRGGEAAL